MSWKKLNFCFPLLGLALGCSSIIILTWGCLPADLARTRVVDARGDVVHEPPLEPKQILHLPPTGRDSLDYVVASAFAAAYGAFGYWIRRVKINGAEQLLNLQTRVKDLESPAAGGILRGPAGSSAEDLRRLSRFLDFEARMENGKPPGDGTAQ